MSKIELLQYNQLVKVPEMTPSQLAEFDDRKRKKLITFLKNICQENGYGGIATNEIDLPYFQAKTGLRVYPRCIYVDSNNGSPVDSGCVIFNPRDIGDQKREKIPFFSKCGSLSKFNNIHSFPSFFYEIYEAICLTGIISDSSGQILEDEQGVYRWNGLISHETDHLEGKTVVSLPNKLKNPFENIRHREEVVETNSNMSFEEITKRAGKYIIATNQNNLAFYEIKTRKYIPFG